MKYVIFGGNGFVGSHLTSKLCSLGANVVIADINKEVNPLIKEIDKELLCYKVVDIRIPSSFRDIKIDEDDIVINLAANQYHNKVPKNAKEYFFSTNVDGVRNILEFLKDTRCRKYIQFTTDMIYGKPQYLPVDTAHPQNPFGYYGQSKKIAEEICFDYRNKGFNISIFRPRMIVGPGRLGILKKLFKLIDLNLPVPTIGSGKNHYQMVSVFDCVDAVIKAIEKGVPNSEYNLGSKNPPSINELLKNVINKANSKSILIHTYGPLIKVVLSLLSTVGLKLMYKEQYMIADEEYILDIRKTVEELDWNPKFNDSDMIYQAYKEYNMATTPIV